MMISRTFLLLFFVFSISKCEVQLGCTSPPLPDANGLCPDGYTLITAGGCCPDSDVYSKFALHLKANWEVGGRHANGTWTLLIVSVSGNPQFVGCKLFLFEEAFLWDFKIKKTKFSWQKFKLFLKTLTDTLTSKKIAWLFSQIETALESTGNFEKPLELFEKIWNLL